MVPTTNEPNDPKRFRQLYLVMCHTKISPNTFRHQCPFLILDPTDMGSKTFVVFWSTTSATPQVAISVQNQCDPEMDIPRGYKYYQQRKTISVYEEAVVCYVLQDQVLRIQTTGEFQEIRLETALQDFFFIFANGGNTSNIRDFMIERNEKVARVT